MDAGVFRWAQGFATKTQLQLTFFLSVPVCFLGDNSSTGDNHFPFSEPWLPPWGGAGKLRLDQYLIFSDKVSHVLEVMFFGAQVRQAMLLGPRRAPPALLKLNGRDRGVGEHLRHFTGSVLQAARYRGQGSGTHQWQQMGRSHKSRAENLGSIQSRGGPFPSHLPQDVSTRSTVLAGERCELKSPQERNFTLHD